MNQDICAKILITGWLTDPMKVQKNSRLKNSQSLQKRFDHLGLLGSIRFSVGMLILIDSAYHRK